MDNGRTRGMRSADESRSDLDDFLEEQFAEDPANRDSYEDAVARETLLRVFVERRKALNLSQGDVAAKMGTTQSAVSDLERGAVEPKLSTVQRYARAVDCKLVLRVAARDHDVMVHRSGWRLLVPSSWIDRLAPDVKRTRGSRGSRERAASQSAAHLRPFRRAGLAEPAQLEVQPARFKEREGFVEAIGR